MMPAIQRRIGTGAMGLYLIDMTIWILGMIAGVRGHIPHHAVRAAPSALPVGAVMGVFATATFIIGAVAAILWATVWVAIKLI
jgi:hypothetical protein